jgi:hypothetical protein
VMDVVQYYFLVDGRKLGRNILMVMLFIIIGVETN